MKRKDAGPCRLRSLAAALPARAVIIPALALTVFLCMPACRRQAHSPRPGGTLRVGISTDVETWSFNEFPAGDARYVWSQVYETLVRLTPDLKITPGLAVSWTPSEDGSIWDFRLREGVTFHDGSRFTAAAVIASYGPDSYSRKTVLKPVEAIEARGDHAVRFRLQRPMPLPFYLTHVGWPVMRPPRSGERGHGVCPVGTGPFRFESHDDDRQIVLAANAQYWGKRPAVAKVIFKVVPAAPARTIALEAGELDMIVKVPESDVARLEHHPDVTVHRRLSTFTDFLQFNCLSGPFRDVRLRRAVAYAVDTVALVRDLLAGVGQPARGRPFSPAMLYSDAALDLYECDPARARRLVAEAGWQDADGDGTVEKDGRPLRVVLLVTENANVASGGRFLAMAEAVHAALRKIGMDVRIMRLEGGAFLRAERKGRFDMLLRTGFYVWGNYPRHFFLHQSGNMYSHVNDSNLDALITTADATITSPLQRERYKALQQKALRLLPAFYLVHQEKVVAARRWVGGYRLSAEPPWLNLKGVHFIGSSVAGTRARPLPAGARAE